MLVAPAGGSSVSIVDSSLDGSGESGYVLPSVTGVMYVLFAFRPHDLRAGFSLSVHGPCADRHAFGIGLLRTSIPAGMNVLETTSAGTASVVLDAATFRFITDLVSKASRVHVPLIPCG